MLAVRQKLSRMLQTMFSRLSMNWWIIVLLSFAIAVLIYLILREPSEDAWGKFLDALARLSVSYVAGVIIYLLAVALPRRQNQRNIGESISPRTRKIINHADETLGCLNRLHFSHYFFQCCYRHGYHLCKFILIKNSHRLVEGQECHQTPTSEAVV